MKLTYGLWRLVAIRDESRSTWELVGRFANARQAQRKIHELARNHIVSPDEGFWWYEDNEGTHTFRIEAAADDE